jgi:hypothetical protein
MTSKDYGRILVFRPQGLLLDNKFGLTMPTLWTFIRPAKLRFEYLTVGWFPSNGNIFDVQIVI